MDVNSRTQEIVDLLDLSPHPEGGYYREVFRSDEEVIRADGESRDGGTAIYFLLPSEVCTSWHRVRSDELWHFYEGVKLILEIISPDGNFRRLFLCDKLSADCDYQGLVPQNCWQRAYSTGAYTLAGCTVTPGFEFEDFEMTEKEELAKRHPNIAREIKKDPFYES